MEKLSGRAKEIKNEKDIRNTENSFTPVNVTNCSAKAASVKKYSSDSQDIS